MQTHPSHREEAWGPVNAHVWKVRGREFLTKQYTEARNKCQTKEAFSRETRQAIRTPRVTKHFPINEKTCQSQMLQGCGNGQLDGWDYLSVNMSSNFICLPC